MKSPGLPAGGTLIYRALRIKDIVLNTVRKNLQTHPAIAHGHTARMYDPLSHVAKHPYLIVSRR